ncbi:MAG: hypothetical protein ACK4MX_13650 [Thermaurantiacus sp.]
MSAGAFEGKALGMSEQSPSKAAKDLAREERLAARLRENLRRRKAQARAMNNPAGESPVETLSKPAGES